MKLKVLTDETQFGGRNGANDRHAQIQIGLTNKLRLDMFLMQEAKGFQAHGSVWLYALEVSCGTRDFLASAPRTGQNLAILVREPRRALSFDTGGAHFRHGRHGAWRHLGHELQRAVHGQRDNRVRVELIGRPAVDGGVPGRRSRTCGRPHGNPHPGHSAHQRKQTKRKTQ